MGRASGRLPAAAPLFYGALAALALLGVRDVLFLYEENRCSMTYMFEYPEYLKIKLPKKTARRYPAYELYLYGEGNYAEENKNLVLTGIPVLFLPGNAGSYKQVRSLGSIALRKAEDLDFKYHFNFFTVNFNEELVALYGGTLQRQTKFVHECIKVILKLYRDREFAPSSVAIVGHSMGGLVARALLTLKNFKPELINLLITQATPHVAPVMPLDKYITDFYTAVSNHWILNAQELRNLTTLSVAGGFRDYQVRSGLAFLPRLSQQDSALSVVSSAVPRAWASTDHLSIITEDPKKRMSVLNHHFVRHPGKIFEENPEAFTELTGDFTWIEVKTSKWTYSVYNDSDGKYFVFPLASHRKSYSHVYCENSMLVRKYFFHVSSLFINLWTSGNWQAKGCVLLMAFPLFFFYFFKVVILKLQDYPSLSHIVILVPPTVGNKFTLDCEFFKEDSRTVQLPVTNLFSFEKTSVYRLHIPWSHEDSVTVAKVPSSSEISAKLHVAQPGNDSRVPVLNIYSSSDCQYEVSNKHLFYTYYSYILVFQIIRFHAGALPVYVVSNILLTYGGQLSTLMSTGQCSEFSLELIRTAKPYKVEPIISIVVFLQGFNWFREIWDSLSLPEVDAAVLSSQDVWFPLVSLILFLLGAGIAYWSAVFFSASLRVFSTLWLILIRPTVLQKDNKLFTYRRLCVMGSLALVSWTTCGALAVFVIYLQYLFKVLKTRVLMTTVFYLQDPDCSKETSQNSSRHTVKSRSLRDLTSEPTQSHSNSTTIAETVNSLKIHLTILYLFTWIVLLNLPSLVYWFKNLRYNVRLDPDPCRSTAIILVCILEILMNSTTSEVKSSKLLKIAAKVPLPLSVAMLAFGRMHLYKVPHFVTFSLLLHVLCCLV
uniref:GPI inositol-deacylase n=1 Tax=Anas platyrhynchos TaxID=8839 RepID=A0A8B9TC60_ANAPL